MSFFIHFRLWDCLLKYQKRVPMLRQLLSGNGATNVSNKVDSSDSVSSYSSSDICSYPGLDPGPVDHELVSNGHKNLVGKLFSRICKVQFYKKTFGTIRRHEGFWKLRFSTLVHGCLHAKKWYKFFGCSQILFFFFFHKAVITKVSSIGYLYERYIVAAN